MCYFLSQKVYGKIIFTDYWKNLVLNFSMMGNTVFFESTSWWKRWFILITEKLSETLVFNFSVVWNTVFFWVRKFMERWYLLGLFVLSVIFWDLGNTVSHAVKHCEYTWGLKELEIVVHNCFCMPCLLRLFGTCENHQD